MDEYWNLFLNWLNSIGRFAIGELYNGKRIAPKAEDRYAKSHKTKGVKVGFPKGYDTEGIEQDQEGGINLGYKQRPAKILRYVKEPGDTVYAEYPESSLYGIFDYRWPREASTLNPRGTEYDILSNRYRTAEKLAR